jgi:RiboL-PSP-HEPN
MANRKYKDLEARVHELAASLLPKPSLTGSYSSTETDLIKSYVLLVHAEVESYCEELVLHIVKGAEKRSSPIKCSFVISRLVLYRAASTNKEMDGLSVELIKEACSFYRSQVENNHGVKRQNILRLFIPIGLNHQSFSETLLATLDAFGKQRGAFAHRSFKTHQPLDPVSEKARIDLILKEIKRVDRLSRRLR